MLPLGLRHHQLFPSCRVPAGSPAPIAAKGIEGEALLAGAVAGEYRLSPQEFSKLMRHGFCSGLMPAKKGDDQLPSCIQHQHRWIGLFRLKQRCDQAGDGPQGPHHQHRAPPVLLQKVACGTSQQSVWNRGGCFSRLGGESNGLGEAAVLQALQKWECTAGEPEGKTRALVHSGRDRQQGRWSGGRDVEAG